MRPAERFIELYKEYEAILHDAGEETKSVEDAADSALSNRLRMCRIFRNYLVHNADAGFIEPTPKMISFLAAEVKRRKEAGDIVKKHLKKAADVVVAQKAKATEVLEKMVTGGVPMVAAYENGKWNLYALSDIAAAVLKSRTAKMASVKPAKDKPIFCGPMDKMSSVDPERFCLCTDTGKPDGKVLGAVKGGMF